MSPRCKNCGIEIDLYQYNNFNQKCPQCIQIENEKQSFEMQIKGLSSNFKSKYRIFLALGILGLFLLIPLSIPYWNFNGFAGVSNGNNYYWDRYFNSSVYDQYLFDLNDSSAESFFSDFVKSNDKIRLKIDEVQNEHLYEINDAYRNITYEYIRGRKIHCEYWVRWEIGVEGVPNPWIKVNPLDILIVENIPEIYSTILLFGNLFIASDVNFPSVIKIIENTLESISENHVSVILTGKRALEIVFYPELSENYTTENGLITTLKSSYTRHGVLQEYAFEYGFETLFKIELIRDTHKIIEISMLSISIGVGISSIGCIVYYIRKRHKEKSHYDSAPIEQMTTD